MRKSISVVSLDGVRSLAPVTLHQELPATQRASAELAEFSLRGLLFVKELTVCHLAFLAQPWATIPQ